jgi:hypothetical protein
VADEPAGRPQWAPVEVDLDRPSVARVYDRPHVGEGLQHLLGEGAVALEVVRPAQVEGYLCAPGIDQFLDLGSGIPTEGNVHEVAGERNPRARVVYVDRDPVAVVHSRRLLEGDERATAVLADVRDAPRVLGLAVESGLDLARPVAVLAVALFHFFGDDDRPAGLAARYTAALAPGSHLALSHGCRSGPSGVEILAIFGDLELVDPGLVPLPRWRADPSGEGAAEVPDDHPAHAGVGRTR